MRNDKYFVNSVFAINRIMTQLLLYYCSDLQMGQLGQAKTRPKLENASPNPARTQK